MSLLCARDFGDSLSGIITLDSSVRPPEAMGGGPPPRVRKKKGCGTQEELLKRLKLMPPQPVKHKWLMDYIGPLSTTTDPTDGTWIWKDDGERMLKTTFSTSPEEMSRKLRGLKCRLAVIYGTESVMFSDPKTLPYMRRELDEHQPGGEPFTPMIAIEGSHHHVMFDEPIAVISCVRATLGEWVRQLVSKRNPVTRHPASKL